MVLHYLDYASIIERRCDYKVLISCYALPFDIRITLRHLNSRTQSTKYNLSLKFYTIPAGGEPDEFLNIVLVSKFFFRHIKKHVCEYVS